MSTDPVCGMEVAESTDLTAVYEGETYRFCSESCLERFRADPESFLDGDEGEHAAWSDYLPLVILVACAALAATARASVTGIDRTGWMHDFMGVFLLVFALLKLFDLPAFASGFAKYDLLAGVVRPWGFVYPLVELGLALGFLARWNPALLHPATVVVMVFGALGVLRSLVRGDDLDCVCMGSILDVPLSVVTLTEDLGMAAMATWLWLGATPA